MVGATLDPRSLILSQFSDSLTSPNFLQLTTESFVVERGPRYKAYADLRESKLRLKTMKNPLPPPPPQQDQTPPKKQIKFQGSLPVTTPNRRKGSSSILTQSVPDFSKALLRKENRMPAPATMLSPVMEKSATPPPAGGSKSYSKLGGSKSVNSGEKKSGGGLLMARKSYASVEELKGWSAAAANAINGENRGVGRTIGNSRGVGKTVLGYRQYY